MIPSAEVTDGVYRVRWYVGEAEREAPAEVIRGAVWIGSQRLLVADCPMHNVAFLFRYVPEDSRQQGLPDSYSVGQVAHMLGCSVTTVKNMTRSGELEGYTLPGSRMRRYAPEEVLRVLRKCGAPVPKELQEAGI